MEHCFRIALGMLFLVGYLQAKPVTTSSTIVIADLHIDDLQEKVSCESNMTFVSPTNVERDCFAAALKHFSKGLTNAQTNCTGDDGYINDSLETLSSITIKPSSPECKWESRKEFKEFVGDLETVAQNINALTLTQGR